MPPMSVPNGRTRRSGTTTMMTRRTDGDGHSGGKGRSAGPATTVRVVHASEEHVKTVKRIQVYSEPPDEPSPVLAHAHTRSAEAASAAAAAFSAQQDTRSEEGDGLSETDADGDDDDEQREGIEGVAFGGDGEGSDVDGPGEDEEEDDGEYEVEEAPPAAASGQPPHHGGMQHERPEFTYPQAQALHTPSRRPLPVPQSNFQARGQAQAHHQAQQLTPRSAAAASGMMDKIVGSCSPSSRRKVAIGDHDHVRRDREASPSSTRGVGTHRPTTNEPPRRALVVRRPSGSNPPAPGAPAENSGKKLKVKLRASSGVGDSQSGYASSPTYSHGPELAYGLMSQQQGQAGWYGPSPTAYTHSQTQARSHGPSYPMQQRQQEYLPNPNQGYPQHHLYAAQQQAYPAYPQHQVQGHAGHYDVNLLYGDGYAGHENGGNSARQHGYPFQSHTIMMRPGSGYQTTPSPHLSNALPSPSPLLTHTELSGPHFATRAPHQPHHVPTPPLLHQQQHEVPQPHGAVAMGRSFTSDSYMSTEDAQQLAHQAGAVATGTIALEHISGRDDAFKTPAGKMSGRIGGGVHGPHGTGYPHGGINAIEFSPMDDVSTYQSERSASRPISTPSTARRTMGDAYDDTPTRSMTPVSAYSGTESSYQPSAASARKLGTTFVPTSSLAGEDEDDDREVEDAEEDEDEDFRDGQVSPTRLGKGRSLRSAALRRGSRKAPAEEVSGKKRRPGLKPDVKARESARKPAPAALEYKPSAAATQQAKEEYIPENIPPGPRSAEKPPYSYAGLIGQAIKSSSKQRLALHQIYAWIMTAYPFFQKDEAGWQNSIRHNLSLNECFVKSERESEEVAGKGSYWMIAPGAEFQFQNGGFKKHQRTMKDKIGADGLVLGPGGKSTKSKKRKAGELDSDSAFASVVELGQQLSPGEMTDRLSSVTPNITHAVPLTLKADQVRSDSPGDDGIQSGKRPLLEKSLTWTAAEALGHEVPRPMSAPGIARHHSQSTIPRVGGAEDGDLFQAQHGNMFRSRSDHEASFSLPPSQLIAPQHSTESSQPYPLLPPHYPPGSSPFPGALLDRHAGRSSKRMARMESDDTYETPQKATMHAGQDHGIPSSGMSYNMLPPHMTPSASSPATSPSQVPFGMEVSTNHIARAYHVGPVSGHYQAGKDYVPNGEHDMDQDLRSTEYRVCEERPKHLQPAMQLGGSFTFATPAVPAKVRPHAEAEPSSPPHVAQVELIKEESFVLSPMRKGHTRVKSATRLPGLGSLLSSASQRHSDRERAEPNRDLLSHLDRVPGSPARGAAGSLNGFATPLNKSARTRLITADGAESSPKPIGTTTPVRSVATFDHYHVTPAGNSRAQFRAEHGLLESPMGTFGNYYDMNDSGARFDWELQQMTGSKHRRSISRGDDLGDDATQTPFSLLGSVLARKRTSNMRGNEEDDDDGDRQILASPTGAGRKKVYNGKALFVGGSP